MDGADVGHRRRRASSASETSRRRRGPRRILRWRASAQRFQERSRASSSKMPADSRCGSACSYHRTTPNGPGGRPSPSGRRSVSSLRVPRPCGRTSSPIRSSGHSGARSRPSTGPRVGTRRGDRRDRCRSPARHPRASIDVAARPRRVPGPWRLADRARADRRAADGGRVGERRRATRRGHRVRATVR